MPSTLKLQGDFLKTVEHESANYTNCNCCFEEQSAKDFKGTRGRVETV